ncbi:BTAD domain-containing putative transcriptional regulator [Actinosynnema sp. NPDC020468]|uniref:BTAD domain-containing putative transcriptional regulator n=1 Tax=Actinosynnema sp. NPDC020468 TaxID=3154488 RepID=UPI0033D35B80
MRFNVLGPLEVRAADGRAVSVGGPRPRAVLVMLLLEPGRVVGVERLVVGQYADDPPADAVGAVQAQVARLRRVLPAGLIAFTGGGYRIDVDPDDVDVHVFERLAARGRAAVAGGRPAEAVETLRAALALWRGPALVDLPNAVAEAARWAELRLTATEDLVDAELALPDEDPVPRLRALVAEHPLRERFREQLLRALHAAGRPAEALAEFEDARRLLADELGADPAPGLAAAHLAVLRSEPVAPVRPPLPARLTSFVGRDAELRLLADARDARLVTVVGPGGMGKTRLAVEFARRAGREVCFVDLSGVVAGDADVTRPVLAALGVREAGFRANPTGPVDRLVAALDQDVVLLLDNCEHVVAEVAGLVRVLLDRCPRVSVLATSREPLGLTGETVVPLGPPADPVRLFADRAAAARPGVVVDPEEAAGICAALDGVPLAVELAAARLRQFDLAEIARRLVGAERFRLLSKGDRTAAARHRTLRAVVGWSWDLLTPAERAAAARFSVFAAGAPVAAVEAVCGSDDVVADLVDRSLVVFADGRYRMLDTIRLFCAERLRESGDEHAARAAHAEHHLALARRADPHLRDAEQVEWLARLTADHDNLMSALRWAVREDRPTAMRLVTALGAYWWLSGRRGGAGEEAAALLTDEVPDGLGEEYVSCVVHAVPRAAEEHWRRAAAVLDELGWTLRHPFGAALWGMAAGPPDEVPGEPAFAPDPWNAALGALSRGLLEVMAGGDGVPRLREALAGFRALGERWGTAQALDWLALLASRRGEWADAHAAWAEALACYEVLGALDECAELHCHRGESLVREGDFGSATREFTAAIESAARAGRTAPAEASLGLGEVARLRGDLAEADVLLRRAHAAALVEGGARWLSARTATALGRLAQARHDRAAAASWHTEAVECVRTAALAAELASALEGLAGVAVLDSDGVRAAHLLGTAVALRGAPIAGDPDVVRTAAAATALTPDYAAVHAAAAARSTEDALAT